jgi:hypothetical protein
MPGSKTRFCQPGLESAGRTRMNLTRRERVLVARTSD